MKIDRLLGILAVLLRRERVTAPELAEKFEVSRRTISRDIDALCLAGFPVVTEQGRNGGISLAPGYTLDRQLLTPEELGALLAGVRGLDSVSPPAQLAGLTEKLASEADSGLLIDLASHHKASLTEKIGLLRGAIRRKRLVTFRYYSHKGETLRTVEPYYVAFQWGDWYLFSWCLTRKDFRMFKLSRLWELSEKEDSFTPRKIPAEKLDFHRTWQTNYRLEALFAPAAKYRLIEEYGPSCFTVEEGGFLRFSTDFTFYDAMLSWVLSFGDQAEVLAPEQLRADLKKIGRKISERY